MILKISQLILIPVSVIGGKTRLLRPHASTSLDLEVSCALSPASLESTFKLLYSIYENRQDKDQLNMVLSTHLSEHHTPFDLTSLASHREILLLPAPLRVTRIKKMIEINGLLQLSKGNLYFQSIPNFSFRKVKRFPLTTSAGGFTMNAIKYKLKNTGIELQFSNEQKTTNLFILFDSTQDRDLFIKTIQSVSPSVSSDSISSTVSLCPQIPPIHIVTDLWRNCLISNFSYLMYLNFMAGRSVNDIGQYPVLPWTISDMTSTIIDLKNPTSFRDLSTPIAATNNGKLEQAIERSAHMSSNERFLFGSFYSNPAFVLYFLIRKFPECHLRLHGGHFDHSARLFSSLKTSWEAVSLTGSAMMELIPEFYSDWTHAREWLTTTNSVSAVVGDVSLPPWVPNSDPTEFVILMRCALESLTVSLKLHEWIDLVFGVKSRGRQICFDANNLFHPICYLTDAEGDVARYCKETESPRDVVVLQSQEFGHVPKQLFATEPHPPRIESRWCPERSDPAYYRQMITEVGWRHEIISAMDKLGDRKPVVVEALITTTLPDPLPKKSTQKNFALIDSKHVELPNSKSIGPISDFLNLYGEVIAVTSSGYFVSPSSSFRLSPKPVTCLCPHVKKSEFFCGGSEGDVFTVSSTNGRISQKRIHENSVTAIDTLKNGTIGVSGSVDQSIILWETSTLSVINQLDLHSAPITFIHVLDTNRFISGDSIGGIASWDISKPNPLIWTLALGRSRAVVSITSIANTVIVFDSHSSVIVIEGGVVLWDHALRDDKILGGFFPNRNDNSILFIVCECKEGTVVHCANLTWGNAGSITNFSVTGTMPVVPDLVCLSRRITVDNSLCTIAKTSLTVSVIKKKGYYNFEAFSIHILIVS